jgi:geranylgeranyl transferase type-1 subunit beta
MGKLHLIDTTPTRRYLLGKTQHFIGGFGKLPGDLPDLYHSYLALAALSTFGQPELKPVHPAACLSMDACEYLETLPWKQKRRE